MMRLTSYLNVINMLMMCTVLLLPALLIFFITVCCFPVNHFQYLCISHLQTSRMYTVPLYEDLVAGVMKCVAVEIFYETQRRLHPNLRRTLQQILFQTSTSAANQNGPAPPLIHPSTSTPPSPQPPQPASSTTAAAAMALRDVNVLA